MHDRLGKLGDLLKDALDIGHLPPDPNLFFATKDQEPALHKSSVTQTCTPSCVPAYLHNCFSVLDLPINASFLECKKAYKKKIKGLHPDTAHTKNTTQLQKVIQAFNQIKEWYRQN